MDELLGFIGAYPAGVSAGEIARRFDLPRTSLNRQLKQLQYSGQVVVIGKGPATRYQLTDALAVLRAYFAKSHTAPV